jgi:DNA-binding MarR family transcriptional regulator
VTIEGFGAGAAAQLVGPFMDYLARRVRSDSETELTAFNLRLRHVVVLTLLRDFGERSQSDLAEALGIDPTNLVALLNDLESNYLVDRRRSVVDRRRHTVSLTPPGRQRLDDVEHVLAAAEKRLLGALNEAEQNALYRLLQKASAGTAGGSAVDSQREQAGDDDCP